MCDPESEGTSSAREDEDAMVRTWISPKAAKGRPSAIAGRGLFALESFSPGEVVAVKGGHVVTTEQLCSLPERLQNSEVQITDDLHLVALTDEEYEAVMLFINHSCEPNVGFAGNVVLVAMRHVEAGEELTTDYAMFDDYEGSMECSCGRASCRGRVDGRDWQRADLQARYRGYFSWYLQQRSEAGSNNREAVSGFRAQAPDSPRQRQRRADRTTGNRKEIGNLVQADHVVETTTSSRPKAL